MQIKYEIKTKKEFKELPVISKLGILLFFIGCIGLVVILALKLSGQSELLSKIPKSTEYYCLGSIFVGFFVTLLFDKKRKEKTKVSPKGPS